MCLGATEVNQDSVDSLLTLGLGDYSGQPPPQYHHPHAQHSSFQCKDECSQGGEILRNKTAEYFRLCSFGAGGLAGRGRGGGIIVNVFRLLQYVCGIQYMYVCVSVC